MPKIQTLTKNKPLTKTKISLAIAFLFITSGVAGFTALNFGTCTNKEVININNKKSFRACEGTIIVNNKNGQYLELKRYTDTSALLEILSTSTSKQVLLFTIGNPVKIASTIPGSSTTSFDLTFVGKTGKYAIFTINQNNNFVPTVGETPTPIKKKCKVHTYKDAFYGGTQKCIDNIWTKGVYFIAKDKIPDIQPYWSESMVDVLGQIKNFYEGQFSQKINVTIDAPILVYGKKNISEYDYSSISEEVYSTISNTFPNDGHFIDIQIFLLEPNGIIPENGGTFYNGLVMVNDVSMSVNPSSWLNSDMLGTVTTKYGTNYQGYLGSAHEFGHSLYIPHPWEESINKDLNGNIINQNYGNDEIGSIMSYTGQKGPLMTYSFIRDQIKEKMITEN